MYNNQRHSRRFSFNLPINLSFGTQITLQGQIKDLSSKSAFINVKSSIHMAPNDELNFTIENIPNQAEGAAIKGTARISRVAAGEGIAIFFTKMDEESASLLSQLSNKASIEV